MKPVDDLSLGIDIEVHQRVPAYQQVQPRDRGVTRDVVPAEDHPAPQLRPEGELGPGLLEILIAQLGRHQCEVLRGINARPGVTQGIVVYVSPVDLDSFRGFIGPQGLGERYGQRVRLLAAGTSGAHPLDKLVTIRGRSPLVGHVAGATELTALKTDSAMCPGIQLAARSQAGTVHPRGVESKKAATGPGNAASAQQEDMTERERVADERERVAGERERKANKREALADERERKADEREREADRREAALNERQWGIDERERELNERGRELGVVVESLQQRALETVERSRALLALSRQRLNRHETAAERAQAHQERQQAELSRTLAQSKREHAAALPDPTEVIARARALSEQARAVMEAIAANEEEIARLHEELAARSPERREEYRHTAEQARVNARRAREVIRKFTA